MEQDFFNFITKINGENIVHFGFAAGLVLVLKRLAVTSKNDSTILADWSALNSALARKDKSIAKLNENIARLNSEILELHKIVSDLRAKLEECLKRD